MCMSRPSNSQPSQAAMPDFHCAGVRSRRCWASARSAAAAGVRGTVSWYGRVTGCPATGLLVEAADADVSVGHLVAVELQGDVAFALLGEPRVGLELARGDRGLDLGAGEVGVHDLLSVQPVLDVAAPPDEAPLVPLTRRVQRLAHGRDEPIQRPRRRPGIQAVLVLV